MFRQCYAQKFSPDTKLYELALQRDKLGIDGIVLLYTEWNSKRALLEKDIRRLSDFYSNREIKGVEYYELLGTINSIVL